MGSYGRETFDTIGSGITVTADGAPIAKAGGITLAWNYIPAFTRAQTFLDSDAVVVGEKYLRYGMIVCKIQGGAYDGYYVPYGTTTGGGNTIPDATGLSIARGECFILNESVHENDRKSDHPTAIDGGRVYKDRLYIVGSDAIDYSATGEIQTVTLGAGNTGGTFTLTFNGQTTAGIAYDAAASAVESALEALSNLAAADVSVSGSAGGPYTVTFAGDYADTVVPLMTSTPSLTGGTNTVTVAASTATAFTPMPVADFEAAFPSVRYVKEASN